MRSVVVVLPASMWAMIPILRVRASGNSRMTGASAIASISLHETGRAHMRPAGRTTRTAELPAVVRECLVRLGHLVDVVPPLHRRARGVGRVEQLVGQALGHRL